MTPDVHADEYHPQFSGAVPDDLVFTGEVAGDSTVIRRDEDTLKENVEIKTAAELAAERKRLKQLEEERLIR